MKKIYCNSLLDEKGFCERDLYPQQLKVLTNLENNNHSIILKPRQMGITSLLINYLYECALEPNRILYYFNSNGMLAARLMDMIVKIITLDKKISIESINSDELKLSNGSIIYSYGGCSIYREHVQHSEDVDMLILDGAAYYNCNSVIKRFKKYNKIAIISSVGNKDVGIHFENAVKGSINGKSDFSFLELKWYEHPNFNEEWYERMKKLIPSKSFNMEILCQFPEKKKLNKVKKTRTCSFRLDDELNSIVNEHLSILDVQKSEYFRKLILEFNDIHF